MNLPPASYLSLATSSGVVMNDAALPATAELHKAQISNRDVKV
jgi:hypothetical protein